MAGSGTAGSGATTVAAGTRGWPRRATTGRGGWGAAAPRLLATGSSSAAAGPWRKPRPRVGRRPARHGEREPRADELRRVGLARGAARSLAPRRRRHLAPAERRAGATRRLRRHRDRRHRARGGRVDHRRRYLTGRIERSTHTRGEARALLPANGASAAASSATSLRALRGILVEAVARRAARARRARRSAAPGAS